VSECRHRRLIRSARAKIAELLAIEVGLALRPHETSQIAVQVKKLDDLIATLDAQKTTTPGPAFDPSRLSPGEREELETLCHRVGWTLEDPTPTATMCPCEVEDSDAHRLALHVEDMLIGLSRGYVVARICVGVARLHELCARPAEDADDGDNLDRLTVPELLQMHSLYQRACRAA
jgi:hypothetical protein